MTIGCMLCRGPWEACHKMHIVQSIVNLHFCQCTSEHGESFERGRRRVYKERLFGIGGFPFLLSLHILLYSKASYDFETASTFIWS